MRKKYSFSILELMVVVAIMALLSAVGVVYFKNLTKPRVEAEARKIAADITWLRQMTVSSRQHHVISIDTANSTYSVYKSPNMAVSDITPANLIKTAGIKASLSLIRSNLWIYAPQGKTSYSCCPTGICLGPLPPSCEYVTLSDGGKSEKIRVYPETGYIKLEE